MSRRSLLLISLLLFFVHSTATSQDNVIDEEGVVDHANEEFLADDWIVNDAEIEKRAVVVGKKLVFPAQHAITRNDLLTTIPRFSPSFIVKFQVYPTRFQSGWTSIIHLTTYGGDFSRYGDRVPGVFFHPASSRDTKNGLHICSAVNNNRNYCFNTAKVVPRDEWSDVEISQRAAGNAYTYQVKVRGVVIGTVTNTAARSFGNVKVYVGDNFYNAAPGYIRALTIVPEISVGPEKPEPPTVSYEVTDNRFSFKCEFSRNDETPSTYHVMWFTTSAGHSESLYNETLRRGSVSHLPERRGNQLGANIYCKVQTWYTEDPNTKSEHAVSNKYFAGVKIDPSNIELYSGGKPVVVHVTLTVPILCRGNSTSCSITITLRVNSSRGDVLICPSVLVFHSRTWNVSQSITIKTKRDNVNNGAVQIVVYVGLFPSLSTGLVWSTYTVVSFVIRRFSVTPGSKSGVCVSTGDPHIRTPDGFYFNHYYIGDYVLVESKIRTFQVHVRTHRCGSVSCNCGVTAREGNDVLSVNFCGNFYKPFIGYLSKKEPEQGTRIEGSRNGKSFTLRFKSGAFVTFIARPWGSWGYSDITVHIPAEDYRHTIGLCGVFDGNSANDQTDKSGRVIGGKGSAAFTESWRLTRTESIFFYKVKETETETETDGCLPAAEKCSFNDDVGVKKDYKKMAFPGQSKCDAERNTTTSVNVTVLPDGDGDGSSGFVPDGDEFVPTVPTWPTPTGETEENAKNFCKNEIEGSRVYLQCKKVLGDQFTTTVTGFINQCVADVEILDDKVIALQAAMQALTSTCEEDVNNDNSTDKRDFTDNLCANECSGNGVCEKGTCTCNQGYTTEDCSVLTDQVPQLLDVGCGKLCDVRKSDCSRVTVRSEKLVPGRIVCKTGNIVTGAELINFAEVMCGLPDRRGVKDRYLTKRNAIPIGRYNISLSNDGTQFSSNVLPVTVYDSKCMLCPESCEGKPTSCTFKENTCLINGHCYAQGDVDPTNIECGICHPTTSTSQFVLRKDRPDICAVNGEWGEWSTFGACSSTCGGGVSRRSRVCDNPAPANGGAECTGSAEETRTCNENKCPVLITEVKSGYCTTSLTREECYEIAENRGIRFLPIINLRRAFPTGCYHKQTNDVVYYNARDRNEPCTRIRICICRKSGNEMMRRVKRYLARSRLFW